MTVTQKAVDELITAGPSKPTENQFSPLTLPTAAPERSAPIARSPATPSSVVKDILSAEEPDALNVIDNNQSPAETFSELYENHLKTLAASEQLQGALR